MKTAKQEQAERVVRNFNRMRPSLEGFAKALTGKRYAVKIGGNTLTDGETIFFYPPFSLGDNVEHDRHLCEERNDFGTPLCPACKIREGVLIQIYHEISHLAFGSFSNTYTGYDLLKLVESSTFFTSSIAKSKMCHAIRAVAPYALHKGIKNINPFMFAILNALEDVRVDSRMMKARPGTEIMHFAMKNELLDHGYTGMDGKNLSWTDLDLNAQFVIMIILQGEGFDRLPDFDPYVLEAFEDEQILSIVNQASGAYDTLEIALLAIRLLLAGQSLGFFLSENPDKNYTEEEDSQNGDSSTGGEDEGVQREGGSSNQNSDGRDGSGSGSGADVAGGGGGNTARDDQDSGDSSESDDNGYVSDHKRRDEESVPDATESDMHSSGECDSFSELPPAEHGGGCNGGSNREGDEEDKGKEREGRGGSVGDADLCSQGGPGEDGDIEDSGDAESGVLDGGGAGSADGQSESKSEVGLGRRKRGVEKPNKDFGSSVDVSNAFEAFIGHDSNLDYPEGEYVNRALIDIANKYVENFDSQSELIKEVRFIEGIEHFPCARKSIERAEDYVGEDIISQSLMHLRRALTDNARAKMMRNKRSGRINKKVLGRRAWSDDDRLFQKKSIPGKRDYAVLIGIDISGSTSGVIGPRGFTICDLEVYAAYAQAEMCHRLGIKFAVYAHTGNWHTLDIFQVKGFNQPWNKYALDKLNSLAAKRANYDGHTLEFYRKRIDEVQATDKIIMYYNDGGMPAENPDEETRILKDEIATCARKGIVLMGVGALSEEPKKYGLDTVRIDEVRDIPLVVQHLAKQIKNS